MIFKALKILKGIEIPKHYFGSVKFDFSHNGNKKKLVRPNSDFHKRLFANYLSEEKIKDQKKFFNHFPQLETYVDIGSNLGYFATAVTASKTFKNIYLFEPSKYNLKFLKKNFSEVSNCKIFEMGLSDSKREAVLSMPLSKYNNWYNKLNNTGIMSLHGDGNFRKESIQIDTLDNIQELNNIVLENAFIKIDIEGHEYYALKGMTKALKGNNVFQVEVNSTLGTEQNPKVFELFYQNGYKSFKYSTSNDLFQEIKYEEINKDETEDVFFKR